MTMISIGGGLAICSTFLRRVSCKWAKELPQPFAAARGACHHPSLMLFQGHHNQRFFPAVEARIVVHRHDVPLSTISQKS